MTGTSDRHSVLDLLFRRRYGNPIWDSVLRLSGFVALLAIPLALYVPRASGMVGFFIVTVWVNGPISPILPATFEPILMLMGRLYPAFLVASVAVVGTLYVEYLNYHIHGRVLQISALESTRNSQMVTWVLKLFSRAPFFTVWLFSWSPLPYWTVRFISPLAGYDVRRHLLATFLGRYPRLWFIAWLGVWLSVSLELLFAITAGSILVAVTVYVLKRRLGRRTAQPAVAASMAAERERTERADTSRDRALQPER
jgi:hypothetical protein